MSTPDPSRKFSALIRKLREEHADAVALAAAPPPDGMEPIIHEFVHAFLVWEAGTAKGSQGVAKLLSTLVDLNELRVCLADDLVGILGERYPKVRERAERLRSALTEIYKREHGMTLAQLGTMPKRDARAYMESLDGVPAFVAARVLLVSLGGHAVPIDQRLHSALAAHDAVDEESSADDACGWAERQVKAGEASEVYAVLEAWVGSGLAVVRQPSAPKRAAAARGKSTPAAKKGRKRAASEDGA